MRTRITNLVYCFNRKGARKRKGANNEKVPEKVPKRKGASPLLVQMGPPTGEMGGTFLITVKNMHFVC
jgi:hypothetical protein